MRRIALISLLSGVSLLSTAFAAPAPKLAPPVAEFAAEVSERHGLKPKEVQAILAEAQFQQSIIDAMTRPAERLPWHKYRPIFLKPERIDAGVQFWQENEELLAKVSAEYGVPAEILVAIVGVETYYGRFKGKFRVLDALTTLAFHYPPRAAFFRGELEHFLLLAQEEGLDPLTVTGSYAGAMGMPQFIPSSYRNYAADGDDDKARDLFDNKADILASVANYFSRHKWQSGQPLAFPAKVEGESALALASTDLALNSSVAALTKAGVGVEAELAADAAARLLPLELADGSNEHWLVLNNFYVITRYNRSNLYAMAVFQLSEAIRAKREAAR